MSSKTMVVTAAQAAVVAAIDSTTAARITLDEALKLPDDAPPPAPTITNATIVPSSLPVGGGTVTIDATVTDATTVTLNGSVVALPAQRTVTDSTTFVLGASGPGGNAAPVSLTVTVAVAPPTGIVVTSKTINPARAISVGGYLWEPNRYERNQDLTVLRPDANGRARVRAFPIDLTAGGGRIPWGAAIPLTLTFDGRPVAVATTATTNQPLDFDVLLSNITEGWYMADVTGAPAPWSTLPYGVYVLKGAEALPHTHMPSVTSSYELTGHSGANVNLHQSCMVPAIWKPRAVPLIQRTTYPNVTQMRRDKWVCERLSPVKPIDTHTPVVNHEGIWSTANTQAYHWADFQSRYPLWPLLDGPRGVGTITSPTHIELGTAFIPSRGGWIDNIYFTDCWRFAKRRRNGDVVTLAGYRHRQPPPYRRTGDPWSPANLEGLELVGDWSAIPPERHGFRELWGIAWDTRSLAVDETAPMIVEPAGPLAPHFTGPVVFLADMLNSRVCKLKFASRQDGIPDHLIRDTPPKVTEFWRGGETWDCVECGAGSGVLAVSVRLENRVVFLSMDSGQIIAEFSTPAPEGLFWQDGSLYYGSATTDLIRQRDVTISGMTVSFGTDAIEVDLRPYAGDTNIKYIKFALSDGTFGPRGMVALVNWSNTHYGYPRLFIGGQHVNWHDSVYVTDLVGPVWPGTNGEHGCVYTTGVGIARGRLICGNTHHGLLQLSAATLADVKVPPAVAAGLREYWARGYHLIHGYNGYGHDIAPLPWGESANMDAYLAAHGHMRS